MLNEVAPCKSFMSSLQSSLTSYPRTAPVRGPAKHSCKHVFMATGMRREKWSKACSSNHNGCAVIRRRGCVSFWNLWSSKHSIDGRLTTNRAGSPKKSARSDLSAMRALHPHIVKGPRPMRYATVLIAFVLGIAAGVIAEQPHANLGVLTCTVVKPAQEAGYKMTCGFKPAGTGVEEKYSGTIRESGQDIAAAKVVFIWLVMGPADEKMRAGILAQRYVKGVAASGQPPLLVGENDPRIALHFETNNGVASYETITQIELVLTGTPA